MVIRLSNTPPVDTFAGKEGLLPLASHHVDAELVLLLQGLLLLCLLEQLAPTYRCHHEQVEFLVGRQEESRITLSDF